MKSDVEAAYDQGYADGKAEKDAALAVLAIRLRNLIALKEIGGIDVEKCAWAWQEAEEALTPDFVPPSQHLFMSGQYTFHAGQKSNWKIECDALKDADWETLASMIAKMSDPFGGVIGIPTGGIKLANALARVLADAGTRERFAHAGRNKVEDRFDLRRNVATLHSWPRAEPPASGSPVGAPSLVDGGSR